MLPFSDGLALCRFEKHGAGFHIDPVPLFFFSFFFFVAFALPLQSLVGFKKESLVVTHLFPFSDVSL